jgi:uncharacterized protein
LTIHEPRTYRDFGPSDRFTTFRVVVETSDLYVKAHGQLEAETERLVRECRSQMEDAITRRREFLTSLVPVEEHEADAPIVARMIRAGRKAGTGPMAGVAAAVAEYVGHTLLERSSEVIVENGGDLFLKVDHPIVVGIFAGKSVFSNRLGIRVGPTPIALGLCTSSATVGPSLSLGKADAATIVSRDAILADAVATGLGNRVSTAQDLQAAVEWALTVPGVDGALAILGDKMAAAGELELVPLR